MDKPIRPETAKFLAWRSVLTGYGGSPRRSEAKAGALADDSYVRLRRLYVATDGKDFYRPTAEGIFSKAKSEVLRVWLWKMAREGWLVKGKEDTKTRYEKRGKVHHWSDLSHREFGHLLNKGGAK